MPSEATARPTGLVGIRQRHFATANPAVTVGAFRMTNRLRYIFIRQNGLVLDNSICLNVSENAPGPESMYGSRENQSKALNRRRIDERVSPLIGLVIGLQILSPTLGQRTSAWQGGPPMAQRALCCLHRTSEHHPTAAYPHFPVPKIAALPRVHPPKLPMYSQSRAAA
jgi:hypothetical protein